MSPVPVPGLMTPWGNDSQTRSECPTGTDFITALGGGRDDLNTERVRGKRERGRQRRERGRERKREEREIGGERKGREEGERGEGLGKD